MKMNQYECMVEDCGFNCDEVISMWNHFELKHELIKVNHKLRGQD